MTSVQTTNLPAIIEKILGSALSTSTADTTAVTSEISDASDATLATSEKNEINDASEATSVSKENTASSASLSFSPPTISRTTWALPSPIQTATLSLPTGAESSTEQRTRLASLRPRARDEVKHVAKVSSHRTNTRERTLTHAPAAPTASSKRPISTAGFLGIASTPKSPRSQIKQQTGKAKIASNRINARKATITHATSPKRRLPIASTRATASTLKPLRSRTKKLSEMKTLQMASKSKVKTVTKSYQNPTNARKTTLAQASKVHVKNSAKAATSSPSSREVLRKKTTLPRTSLKRRLSTLSASGIALPSASATQSTGAKNNDKLTKTSSTSLARVRDQSNLSREKANGPARISSARLGAVPESTPRKRVIPPTTAKRPISTASTKAREVSGQSVPKKMSRKIPAPSRSTSSNALSKPIQQRSFTSNEFRRPVQHELFNASMYRRPAQTQSSARSVHRGPAQSQHYPPSVHRVPPQPRYSAPSVYQGSNQPKYFGPGAYRSPAYLQSFQRQILPAYRSRMYE